MELVFSGLSTRKAATFLEKVNVKVSHVTVYNWAEDYAEFMETYPDRIRPQVSEAWRTDEIYMSIKGNRRYLFAMLDSETRYWIAKMVAEHKGNDDVAPMFAKTKKVAGKVPTTLISDKAANFHHAWEQQYRAKNFLHKDTWHINEIAFDGIHHTPLLQDHPPCRGVMELVKHLSVLEKIRSGSPFFHPWLGHVKFPVPGHLQFGADNPRHRNDGCRNDTYQSMTTVVEQVRIW